MYGGGTPSKKVEDYWNGSIPWASVKDLSGSVLRKTEDSITEAGLENSASKVATVGTLLIATRMAVGKVVITDIDVAINQDLKAIVCNENIFPKYLFYFLKSSENKFETLSSGATVKGIKLEHILDLKIPLPSLAEQKQIAAILDAADALRQKDQQLVDHYTQLSQSLFLDMFGDNSKFERVLLDSVVSNKKDFVDGPFGSNLKVSDQTVEGVRLIQINNIGVGEFRNTKKKYTSEEKYLSIIKHSVQPNDVVVAKMGDPLGRACLVPKFIDKGLVVADCMRIRVASNKFSEHFVMYFLNSLDAKNQINNLSHGSTRVRINLSMLKQLKIPSPSLELQNQFAVRIEKIEQQKQQAQANLEKSNDLFNALLQKAFTGKLTQNQAA
jgi:type I restriction enzyme S subunit